MDVYLENLNLMLKPQNLRAVVCPAHTINTKYESRIFPAGEPSRISFSKAISKSNLLHQTTARGKVVSIVKAFLAQGQMPHVFGQHVHTIGLDQLTFHFALHTGPALARVFYFSRSLHLDGREVPRDASGPVRRAVWRMLPLLVCLSVRRTHREGCCPCHSVVVYSQLDEREGDDQWPKPCLATALHRFESSKVGPEKHAVHMSGQFIRTQFFGPTIWWRL
jgi:hypothetical protein